MELSSVYRPCFLLWQLVSYGLCFIEDIENKTMPKQIQISVQREIDRVSLVKEPRDFRAGFTTMPMSKALVTRFHLQQSEE